MWPRPEFIPTPYGISLPAQDPGHALNGPAFQTKTQWKDYGRRQMHFLNGLLSLAIENPHCRILRSAVGICSARGALTWNFCRRLKAFTTWAPVSTRTVKLYLKWLHHNAPCSDGYTMLIIWNLISICTVCRCGHTLLHLLHIISKLFIFYVTVVTPYYSSTRW
jgi:hypothetical protein